MAIRYAHVVGGEWDVRQRVRCERRVTTRLVQPGWSTHTSCSHTPYTQQSLLAITRRYRQAVRQLVVLARAYRPDVRVNQCASTLFYLAIRLYTYRGTKFRQWKAQCGITRTEFSTQLFQSVTQGWQIERRTSIIAYSVSTSRMAYLRPRPVLDRGRVDRSIFLVRWW